MTNAMRLHVGQDCLLCVQTQHGDLTLAEFARYVRRANGLNVAQLERQAGLDHPRWYNLERGKYKSATALLAGLDALGYDITITKGEV